MPDHSILLGTFNTSIYNAFKSCNDKDKTSFKTFEETEFSTRQPKKDFKKIQDVFFTSDTIKTELENTILNFENFIQSQSQLDNIWWDVKKLDTLCRFLCSSQLISKRERRTDSHSPVREDINNRVAQINHQVQKHVNISYNLHQQSVFHDQ